VKVCITGGAGFIGSHLAEHFAGRAEVVVLDDLSSGRRENLAGLDVQLITGSILDPEAVRTAVDGARYVFHLAAMVSVPESMADPARCVRVNTLGSLNVLEAAADAGVEKLCLSSSAAVYGDNPVTPKREDMLPDPKSPYAVTKLSGEYFCDMFRREGRLDTVCLRYFNVFGPRQAPGSRYAAVVPIFISRALDGLPLTVYGDGGQTRDFIFVKDVVAANVHLAGRPDCAGVYNVAYGGCMTINDLAARVIQLTGSTSSVLFAPERPGDVRHSTADIGRLEGAGFRPTGDFDRGLEATIAFYRTLRTVNQPGN